MPKNRTDWIKEELQKDFDASAQDVADKLRKRGVTVDPQHVYQVRSQIRKAKDDRINAARLTREQNKVSLTQLILVILEASPNGLSDRELEKAIKKAGYVSRAADFLDVLRKKLYEMTERGQIVKNGLQYTLVPKAEAKAEDRMGFGNFGPGGTHFRKGHEGLPAVAAAVDQPTVNNDYELLRQAVVDYAKGKGFKNPDTFPDTLIRQRRELLEAQESYASVFESGGAKLAK